MGEAARPYNLSITARIEPILPDTETESHLPFRILHRILRMNGEAAGPVKLRYRPPFSLS